MMSFFLNPITMMAGAALISAPIIIHLINRMRFRKIKWAAMEFLLKAQKRMRRKMILEQLILLFLRCLLVLLIGLLFARFLGLDPLQGKETRPTVHVILLDDTPSMADTGRGEGTATDPYAEAKRLITDKILPAVMEATTDQNLRILRLSDQSDLLKSDPNAKEKHRKIDNNLIDEIRSVLALHQKPSTVRTSLVVGLQKASEALDMSDTKNETAKVIHVMTDLRSLDWEQEGESLSQSLRDLSERGVKVHFIDVASPARPTDKSKPLAFSDNVGIIELKPRSQVAAVDEDVDVEVRLKNFGTVHLKDVQVYFFLNGTGSIVQTMQFSDLPAGQERMQLSKINFKRTGTKDDPLARFNIVTAVVANTGGDALAADNVRHAVVEVREKLSVLLIPGPDEDVTRPPQQTNDSYFLRQLLLGQESAFRRINVITAREDSLDKHDLRQYSTVFLVNVPRLTKTQADNLERYVREGGGLGVFLGSKVDPKAYNELLYRNGEGVLPAPLAMEPTKPLSSEEKLKRSLVRVKQIMRRDNAVKLHPAIAGLYTNERGDLENSKDIEVHFLNPWISQHWPISRLGKWRDDRSVRELYCLPNDSPPSVFEPRVAALRDAIQAKYGEPKFEKYRPTVDQKITEIRSLFTEGFPLTKLAEQMDWLLADQVNTISATDALLREFWAQPEMSDAFEMAKSLRDSCKYGDPLYLVKQLQAGRVAVMTTDAGGTAQGTSPWTDWPTYPSWVFVMQGMQKYLTSGGTEENRSVGVPFSVSFEGGRYDPTASAVFFTTNTQSDNRAKAEVISKKLPNQILTNKDGALQLGFVDSNPGVYVFTLKPSQQAEGDRIRRVNDDYFAVALNIDAAREGSLQRAKGNDLADQAKTAEIHSFDDSGWLDSLKQKQSDLSSGRWIYVVILLVLILEQAMAVRLSHHSRPDDLEAFAPSAAAAFSYGASHPAVSESASATTG